MTTTLKVGDRINDPRIGYTRVLRIFELLPNDVMAEHPMSGRVFRILRRRIYTDGKPRRSGFSLITEDSK